MLSRCGHCGMTNGGGNGVPHPLFLFSIASILTGVVVGLLATLSFWWTLAALPLWFGFAYVLWEGPRWVAMLRNRRRACPNCGRSEWERPDYGGFV